METLCPAAAASGVTAVPVWRRNSSGATTPLTTSVQRQRSTAMAIRPARLPVIKAFSYRDAMWAEVIVGVDPDPANAKRITDWTIAYWEALHPYSAGGAYVNMMMDEGVDRIKASYRDNYERLVAIKNRYDPTNLFHVNQNIRPSA